MQVRTYKENKQILLPAIPRLTDYEKHKRVMRYCYTSPFQVRNYKERWRACWKRHNPSINI